MLPNRKRNIPLSIYKEYGQESVKHWQKWKRSKKKMVDFKNHRRFMLRCLDSNTIPVSLRLKSNIKTPKAISIIKKTERALLNERVRTINNTIEMLEHQCHTCRTELTRVLDQEIMAECDEIMFKIKEDRHYHTLERQKAKLDRLIRREDPVNKGGCSNQNPTMQRYMYQSGTNISRITTSTATDTGTTITEDPISRSTSPTSTALKSKWVINMFKKLLTESQEKLLAHGPNYAVTPRSPPIGEYITAVKKTCQNLTQGYIEEMRAEIKAAIKSSHPLDPTSLGKSRKP